MALQAPMIVAPAPGGVADGERSNLDRRVVALLGRGVDLRRFVESLRSEAGEPVPGGSTNRGTGPQWSGPQPGQVVKGVVVEGMNPPSLLADVWRRTPAMADGYRVPICVVQEDEAEAVAGLSRAEGVMDDVIADARVRWFIGAGAGDRLRSHLQSRLEYALPSEYVRSPMLRAESKPTVMELVRGLHEAQQSEHRRLVEAVRSVYAGRDASWWKRRFAGAREGGEPLRVLLPVSRYSTFVRHSATDLAEALGARGVEARPLTEPDDSSRLVSLAYLRSFADWKPDCVVLINYCRRHMGDAVPANIPFVTWVQDRMAHLFDESVGRSLGGLDFVIGHLHRELFDLFAWPRGRRSAWFVPASGRKFHAGPIPPDLSRRHECEIAYVSHQSETPEAGHARLRSAFAAQPALLGVVDALFRELTEAVRSGVVFEGTNRFIIPLLSRALGREPEDRLVNAIAGNYAVPIAERLVRHVSLEWAAEVAERRRWRFHVYGNGWSEHASLGLYARGPLQHDEDLRAAYRSARVHLHLSRNTNAHQRVYECALSGGLMVRRGPSPDATHARWELIRRLLDSGEGLRTPWGDWFIDLVEGEFPDPTLFSGLNPRKVSPGRWRVRLHESWGRYAREKISPVRLEMMPDQAFPGAAETLYSSREELEGRIELAGDPTWRGQMIERQSSWAREHATSDRLAGHLTRFVASGLGG